MVTQEVKDIPAERGISITNSLLTAIMILGGVASYMINYNIENVNQSVVAVETSVNNLNIDAGKMGVKIDNLNKSVEAIGARVTRLERQK